MLANRELYLVVMRLLNSFRVEKYDDVDCDPVTGSADPTSLVTLPPRFMSYFVPRNSAALKKALAAL
jgi:3-hydroxyphenylacetate 6-hydroxylase